MNVCKMEEKINKTNCLESFHSHKWRQLHAFDFNLISVESIIYYQTACRSVFALISSINSYVNALQHLGLLRKKESSPKSTAFLFNLSQKLDQMKNEVNDGREKKVRFHKISAT